MRPVRNGRRAGLRGSEFYCPAFFLGRVDRLEGARNGERLDGVCTDCAPCKTCLAAMIGSQDRTA